MEDVIVQRTTVRSTTENPTPKKNGAVYIQGENITIGTMIVNSPNARVDNSIHQVQQNNYSTRQRDPSPTLYYHSDSKLYSPYEPVAPKNQPAYDSDRDFFKKIGPHVITLLPTILLLRR